MKQEFIEWSKEVEEWVVKGKKLGNHKGIENIATRLYTTKAHFIYELLQNAEDAGATKVLFDLKEDKLQFQHDGKRKFTIEDIKSITRFGNSNKSQNNNHNEEIITIGKFGIGFKAVFLYTSTPIIKSGQIKFKIEELFVPKLIEFKDNEEDENTYFIFPFNHKSKNPQIAYKEIKEGLINLTSLSILFLTNINLIQVKVNNQIVVELKKERKQYIINITDNFQLRKTWLCYSEDAHIKDESETEKKLKVSVAFSLNEAKNQIEQEKAGKVCAFFPCEKIDSKLQFHIHAPFSLPVSRELLIDCEENNQLKKAIGILIANSLLDIQKRGLLTIDFLKVLPNSDDDLTDEGYKIIEDKIKKQFFDKELLPMEDGTYSTANGIFIGNRSTKSLITDTDLATLLNLEEDNEYFTPMWLKAYSNHQRTDCFLNDLKIERWGLKEFLLMINQNDFNDFLISKDAAWHRSLYANLYKTDFIDYDKNQWGSEIKANSLNIVRLGENEGYEVGENCYFTTKGTNKIEGVKYVDEKVYSYTEGNEKEKEEAISSMRFLQKLHVKEIEEEDRIKMLLENNYRAEQLKPKIEDIKTFISFYKKENQTEIFKDYYIFKINEKEWAKGERIFLDTPFRTTNLGRYYKILYNDNKLFALSEDYLQIENLKKDEFIEFLVATGAKDKLEIIKTPCYKNPEWISVHYRVYGQERYDTKTDDDYTIKGLMEIFKLSSIDIFISRLLWDTMNNVKEDYLKACYRPNNSASKTYSNSSLIHLLKNHKWIPQEINGATSFVLPKDADFENMPKDFTIIRAKKWLDAVEFGITIEQKKHEQAKTEEEKKKEEEVFKDAGFENKKEAIEAAELLKNMKESGKTQQEIKNFLNPQKDSSFPENDVKDEKRIINKTREQIANSPVKETIQRTRTINANKNLINAQRYLKEAYTNPYGIMICQLCQNPMPFKKKGGIEYYFEAVEVLSSELLIKEFEAQHLALCPECAARYKEHVKKNPEKMRKVKEQIKENGNSAIPLELDNKKMKLQFVDKHRLQIQVAMVKNTRSIEFKK